jgi:hypothetical protein
MSQFNQPIENALAFCLQWPEESAASVSRIWHIKPATLRSHRRCGAHHITSHGGSNRILSKIQEDTIIRWVADQYRVRQPVTKSLILAAIVRFLRQLNPPKPVPSRRWFQMFMQRYKPDFHTIKTKPISFKRIGVADIKRVEEWFELWAEGLRKYDIIPENIYNMDETGVRIGVQIGREVVIPVDVTEYFDTSPENRKSLTVVETICGDGTVINLYVIIQGKRYMESWYEDRDLELGEVINVSETGFTNDEIALQWLKHFIKEVGRQILPEDLSILPWKILLLDGYGSYMQEEFTLLAYAYKIRCWTFLPHLTYIMQLCDVGIFSTWKHWYQEAITESVGNLNIEYNV